MLNNGATQEEDTYPDLVQGLTRMIDQTRRISAYAVQRGAAIELVANFLCDLVDLDRQMNFSNFDLGGRLSEIARAVQASVPVGPGYIGASFNGPNYNGNGQPQVNGNGHNHSPELAHTPLVQGHVPQPPVRQPYRLQDAFDRVDAAMPQYHAQQEHAQPQPQQPMPQRFRPVAPPHPGIRR